MLKAKSGSQSFSHFLWIKFRQSPLSLYLSLSLCITSSHLLFKHKAGIISVFYNLGSAEHRSSDNFVIGHMTILHILFSDIKVSNTINNILEVPRFNKRLKTTVSEDHILFMPFSIQHKWIKENNDNLHSLTRTLSSSSTKR